MALLSHQKFVLHPPRPPCIYLEDGGGGPSQIPANGRNFQHQKTVCFSPWILYPSASFYSRSFAIFAGKIRIRVYSPIITISRYSGM